MNRQVLAVDQDARDAVQVTTSTPGAAAGSQVFAKVEPSGDAIVALFNTTTTTTSADADISTTVAAINAAIGTFNTNVVTDTAGATYPPPTMPTLSVDPHGYEIQDLWGTNSVVSGGSLATTISSAGSIGASVPPEGVALYRVTPLSGAAFTAPKVTSRACSTFYAGIPRRVRITTSGYPTASVTETGALPTGVFFSDNGNGTATLWGTPAPGSEGTYELSISASNGTNPPATQHYLVIVRSGHHHSHGERPFPTRKRAR
jgi:hypothetical protein